MKHPTITLLLLMTGAVLVVGQLYVTIPLVTDLAQRWQVSTAQSASFGLPSMMTALATAYVILAAGLSRTLPPLLAPASELVLAPMQAASQASPPTLLGIWLAATTVLFGFVTFHVGAQAMGLEAAELQALRLAGLPPLLLSIAAAGLVRRRGTLATARIGLILAATGLLAGWSGQFWTLMVSSVLLSAGIALAVPGLIGTLAGRSNPETRARAMSRYTFALFMGASVAPPIAAILVTQGWSVLLLVPSAALVGATVIVGGWPTAPTIHLKEKR